MEIVRPEFARQGGWKADSPALSFVIITWNSAATISECLEGAARQCSIEGLAYEILVVDNGSTDSTREVVSEIGKVKPVRLMPLPQNMGTTVTRNLALRECKADAVCILDSDAVIKEGSIRRMLKLLDVLDVGIAAPRLVLPDGTVQNSVKRHPSIPAKLLKIPRILFGLPMPDLDFYPDFPFEEKRDVETAISACWFLRRDLLESVGLLDERIFYPAEDIDYCLRVRKAGFRIVYAPFLTVVHHTGQITHKHPFGRMSWIHLRSLAYYFRKHRYVLRPELGRGHKCLRRNLCGNKGTARS